MEANQNIVQVLQEALNLNNQLVESIKTKRGELIEQLDEASSSKYCYEDSSSDSNLILNIKFKHPLRWLKFCRPYLRDPRELSAPCVFEMDECSLDYSMVLTLAYPLYARSWSQSETETILSEVRSQYLRQHTQRLTARWEALLDQQSKINDPKIKKEINKISTEIALCRARNLEPVCNSSDIDWLVISKYLPDDRTASECESYYNNQLHCAINQSEWTSEEDAELIRLVEKYPNDWDKVSKNLATGRRPWQCCSRYQTEYNISLRRTGKIQGEEAEKLNELIERNRCGDYINWHHVYGFFEGRNASQIKYWYEKLKNSLQSTKEFRWSVLEQKVILAGVKLYGTGHWNQIARFLPGRDNRQVRNYYVNHLAFLKRKRGNFSIAEDKLLLKMSTKHFDDAYNINFVDIQRLYFPNRNTPQLYRRYLYLSSILPSDFVLDSDSKISFETRKWKNANFNLNIDDIEDIETFMLDARQKLLGDRVGRPLGQVRKITRLLQENFSSLSVELDPKDETVINRNIAVYANLYRMRRFMLQKIHSPLTMDITVEVLLQSVYKELLSIQPPSPETEPTSSISAFQSHPTLDTMRFFLNNTSVYIHKETMLDIDVPKVLLAPNFNTMYAYSMMQMLTYPMAMQLKDCGDVDELSIVESDDFDQLRSTFRSLFTWPHLICDKVFAEESRRQLAIEAQAPILSSTVAQCDPERSVFDSNKRKRFFLPIDQFTRIRSIQGGIFKFEQFNEFYSQKSDFWLNESDEVLEQRVKNFVNYIVKEFEERKAKKSEKQDLPILEPRAKRRKKPRRSRRDQLPAVPTRRSTRRQNPNSVIL